MDWILDNVAVGSWRDAADWNTLAREGIKAILNVRADEDKPDVKEANEREEKYCRDNGIEYCLLPVPDYSVAEDEQLVHGVAFIEKHVNSGRKVLVHCGGGLGRSPSFVAAYLVFKGFTWDGAVNLIKEKRRGTFETGDNIHIPRIRKFQMELAVKLPEIRKWIESDNPCGEKRR
jgi:protein-tyrosine phosphatase